jgi:hypothetical protein
MRNTMRVREKTSAALFMTVAPALRSASLRSTERFHTTSLVPAASRFNAIG